MTIGEKARAYDKALKWMRELYPGLHGATKEDAEHYFPELRESEDERIRKEIVSALKFANVGDVYDKHIAYLEKQKEHSMSAEEVLAKAGLKPYKDGNQWCILAGDNIQEGICGFGDTIDEALYQFLMEVLEKQKDHFRDDTKKVEQKPADDKAFEEWIDDWWKHNKVNNPDSYDNGDEIQFDEQGFKNFCRGIRNMYQHKPAEWLAIQGYTTEETVDRTPLNGPAGICLNLHDSTGFKIGDKVIVQIRKID